MTITNIATFDHGTYDICQEYDIIDKNKIRLIVKSHGLMHVWLGLAGWPGTVNCKDKIIREDGRLKGPRKKHRKEETNKQRDERIWMSGWRRGALREGIEWMSDWTSEWVNEWINEWNETKRNEMKLNEMNEMNEINERNERNERMNACMHEGMKERMSESVDQWMNDWINEWMSELMSEWGRTQCKNLLNIHKLESLGIKYN